MQAILGVFTILVFAWICSESRRSIEWRWVIAGLSIQCVLVVLLLKVTWIAQALLYLNYLVAAVEQATLAGTTFLFGYVGGGDAPFEVTEPGAMYLFAFRVLPQVIVFSVIIAVLWYWRVLPAVVRGFGWALRRSLGLSGPLGTAGAATLFLGMVETPLLIRAYLKQLTRSEFFTVMTFGMSTVAGSVMVLYASVLKDVVPGVVGHILSASVVNVIGATYLARMIIPETQPGTSGEDTPELSYNSLMDAVTRGTADGLTLAMNVGAMLLVLVSLVALANGIFGIAEFAGTELSLQRIFGWIFAPVAWLIGVPWVEAVMAGGLLGTKIVLNELVAFLQLAEHGTQLSDGTRLIMLYALCGFANFGSLGILLGGLSTLVPERRTEFLQIAPKSLISGTIVTLMTAAIVSIINSI